MTFEIPLENLILHQIRLHNASNQWSNPKFDYVTSNIIEQFGPLVTDEMLEKTDSPELGAPWFILELLDDMKKRGMIK